MQKKITKLYRNLLLFVCMVTGLTASANEYYWVGGISLAPTVVLAQNNQ